MKIFLELADFYDLGPLRLQTEKAAVSKMSCENMVDMYVLADLYRADKLKKAAESLIKNKPGKATNCRKSPLGGQNCRQF